MEREEDFGSPRRQSRVTVAFRWLLALPHAVVLLVLTFVAMPLAVVGWFAALILGRLPRWMAGYFIALIAYSIRVNAYAFMLAGGFPPFAFSVAADYPVTVTIEATPLSRLKVLFRWLLVILPALVSVVVGAGLLIVSPVLWLVTLVRGRMPLPFFGAVSAVVRYQHRVAAYAYLVNDAYPYRLFGDEKYWTEAPDGFFLSVSQGAKWVIGLIAVLGLALCVGAGVLRYETLPEQNPAIGSAETDWEFVANLWEYERTNTALTLESEEGYDHELGKAFDQFAARVSRVLPAASRGGKVGAVVHESRQIAQLLFAASKAKTVADHRAALDAIQLRIDAFAHDAARALGPSPNYQHRIIQ